MIDDLHGELAEIEAGFRALAGGRRSDAAEQLRATTVQFIDILQAMEAGARAACAQHTRSTLRKPFRRRAHRKALEV